MKRWVCVICNYVHEGDEPPDRCPVCNAPRDKFRLIDEDEKTGSQPGLAEVESVEGARDRARELLRGICGVYPQCDGQADRICQRQGYGGKIGLGGAGYGYSFAANVESLASYRLSTQLVGAHYEPDTAFDFFGTALRMPIVGASTSGFANYHEAIDERRFCDDCLEGCRDAGSISFRGDTFFYTEDSHPGLEAIEAAGGHGVQIFKPRDQDVLKRLIERAEKAGCPAVGVDLDGCGSTNMASAGQPVYRKSAEQIADLVKATSLPFICKGLMIPDDALACVQAGAKMIAVSNHGGRVLDSTPGVAEALPFIADRVKGRAMITADGGVRTGYDVLKMLALGADAVLIGRDLIRASIGGGRKGVELHMTQLHETLAKAMVMTGCPTLGDIGPGVLIPPMG
ncbi:MAG: alpha-hydroxy-acid oxidizing protein [Deltaproteobacteria bacterium]|nr:alpha-hydroxy-acid oxidizing protein [Deltaproteobacteria bacterium]